MIARGTADELKAQVGGERLELTVRTVEQLAEVTDALRTSARKDYGRYAAAGLRTA